MITKHLLGFAFLFGLALTLSACSIDVVRNDDGSLTVTSTMTEESFSSELQRAIGGPQMQNLAADMHESFIAVTGERQTPNGTADIAFRLDLGITNGHLSAAISEFTVNGQPANDDRIASWNERIAERLEKQAEKHPNRALESVTITEDDLTLVWHVEPRR